MLRQIYHGFRVARGKPWRSATPVAIFGGPSGAKRARTFRVGPPGPNGRALFAWGLRVKRARPFCAGPTETKECAPFARAYGAQKHCYARTAWKQLEAGPTEVSGWL